MSNDVLKHLMDRKGKLANEIRAHAEQAEARKDGWTAEDTQKWDALNTEYDAINARAEELTKAQAEEARAEEQRAPYERAVRGPIRSPNTLEASRNRAETEIQLREFLAGERRVLDVPFDKLRLERDNKTGAYEVRDLSVGVAAAGGTTVPRTFHAQLYQHLVDASGIRQTNVRIDTTQDGASKDYPKTVSHGTAAIVGEGTALAENDPTFGVITLGSWKYGELIQVTNELITDTGVDLLSYLAEQAGRAIAYAQDDDFFNGSGTNEPYGAFVGMGTAVTGATGGTGVPTINNLIDTYYAVTKPYRQNAYWVGRDATAAWIRKLAVASTAPEGTWGTNLQAGQPDNLLGRPFVTSPFAPAMGTPAKPLGFGDWSTYIVRDVKGVRFERSDDFAFDKDIVTFRAILRSDGDFIDTAGLKAFAGPST